MKDTSPAHGLLDQPKDPARPTRWVIALAANGKVAQPFTGFPTRERAEEYHRAALKGARRFELRPVLWLPQIEVEHGDARG